MTATTEIRTKEGDWNQKFQKLVDELRNPKAETKSLFVELSHLGNEFLYAAQTYGKIIISEVCLKDKKTIPYYISPSRAGQYDSQFPPPKETQSPGVAGGAKYLCNNIFFKFAVADTEERKRLYHTDENVMKAAGHEVRYLARLFETNIPNVHVPLICAIDWCGYRLIASAKLPITNETLIYGSSDGGQNILMKDLAFENTMEKVAKKLNLCRHKCGLGQDKPSQYLYTCIDLEVHRSQTDGRYYFVDAARLFPPEPIVEQTPQQESSPANDPEYYLFRHLRPELVLKWKVPLNPDAFSPFVNAEDLDTRKLHEDEIKKCAEYLKNEVIPNFVKSLTEKYPDSKVNDFRFLTPNRLVLELHQEGINIRHLGHVKACLESHINKSPESASNFSHLKSIILLEMISRVIKNQLNQKMREKAQAIKTPSSRSFDEVIIQFYNIILSDSKFWTQNESGVKKMIITKFGSQALNSTEQDSNMSIAPSDPKKLMMRLEELMGIELHPSAINSLQYTFENQIVFDSAPLSIEDIKQRNVRVKHFPFIVYGEAIYDFLEAQNAKIRDKRMRLLERAIQKFELSSLRSLYSDDNPHLRNIMNLWGDALKNYGWFIELDSTCHDLNGENSQKIKTARIYFEMALEKYQRTKESTLILDLVDIATLKLIRMNKSFVNLQRSLNSSLDLSNEAQAETIGFLKLVLGKDFGSQLEQQNQNNAETMIRWGFILYRVAIATINKKEAESLLEASGKYYLKSLELDSQSFPYLTSWIQKIKVQDVGHIFHIARMNKKVYLSSGSYKENQNQPPQNTPLQFADRISRFESSWVPHLSFDTFREFIQNIPTLEELVLKATETVSDIFEQFPSLAPFLPSLRELSIYHCGTLTSEAVKKATMNCKGLKTINIQHCPQIKYSDFTNFKIGDREIAVIVKPETGESKKTIITHAHTTGARRSKYQLSLFSKDYRILHCFIEYLKYLKKFMSYCDPQRCTKFRVSGMDICWDKEELPPKKYFEKFIEFVSDKFQLKGGISEIKEVAEKDLSKMTDWDQTKLKIYHSLFYLFLHVVQYHEKVIEKYYMKVYELINLGREYHLLIRPEDWWRNEKILLWIEEKTKKNFNLFSEDE